MTTPTERAAEVAQQWKNDYPFAETSPEAIARALAEAGLLPTRESWTVQGNDPEPWIAELDEYTREEAEHYVQRHGGQLVRRYVTEWEEAPDAD